MNTPEQIREELDLIDTKLSSNDAQQQRFSRPCEELFELRHKALDLIVEKARLNFAMSQLT